MKTALVCIAKNEDHYIDEWIKYYFKLGFDDIFVYANDWKFSYDNPNVHISEIFGQGVQVTAYNDFYNKIKNEYQWVAFFDVDEFLVLKKHKNIKDFLKDYLKYPSVGINWVFFGNNGLTKVDGEYIVLKRFTKRQSKIDHHVKSILNTSFNHTMGIHNSNLKSVDSKFREFTGPFNQNGDDEIVQLNHYFSKTIEEFQNKIDRGRADSSSVRRSLNEYEMGNFNEIDDFYARDFMFNN